MAGRTYSKAAAEAIKGALAETKVTYSFNEIEGGSRGVFLAVIALNGRLQKTKYIIDVKNDSYIVYAVLPINADASDKRKMLNLADFICRLNHRLAAGNFELDMDDGQVRFKYYVNCSDSVPTRGILTESLVLPKVMLEHYGDGLLNVIISGADAKEEAERCKSTF